MQTDDRILLAAPMPIQTPRLILRPLQEGDGQALFEAKVETWDSLSKIFEWTSRFRPDQRRDEVYARQCHAQYILREDFSLVGIEKETQKPVIWTGIHPHDWRLKNFQIGFWVRQSAQEKGYASETANALIRYGFGALGAQSILWCHGLDNQKSAALAKKFGFVTQGIKPRSMMIADRVVDAQWYHRLDADNLPPLEVSWG